MLRSWARAKGKGLPAPCQLAPQGQREVRPSELGSKKSLAEELSAERGSILADLATSHIGSQQTLHTGPKGCLSSQFSGEILSEVAEQSLVSLSEQARVCLAKARGTELRCQCCAAFHLPRVGFGLSLTQVSGADPNLVCPSDLSPMSS